MGNLNFVIVCGMRAIKIKTNELSFHPNQQSAFLSFATFGEIKEDIEICIFSTCDDVEN